LTNGIAAVPRVLQVSRSVIDGGFDYHAEIARGFVERGAEVCTVFQRGQLSAPRRQAFPGRVICLDAAAYRRYKRPAWLALALRRAVQGRAQDIAICHHLTPAKAVQLLLRMGLVKQAALVVHDFDYFDAADKYGRRRNRYLSRRLRHPWRLIGVSESICRNVRSQLRQLPPERCQVIHNAIDAEALERRLLARAEARRALGLRPDEFVFGTVGRLVAFKAHDDLIAAFAQAIREMPEARLIIIGRGPLESQLRAQLAKAGLQDRVLVQGFLDDAARYMTAFDVFVLPSRDEPFGLVLLEAMVSRLPILASDSGASREILHPEAWLFPCGDRAALAQRLVQVYRQTAAERAALGRAGYDRVQSSFALAGYRAAYAELLDRDAGAR
jgi:glycosyltransferase involved in cell wall biosynthesis